MNLNVSATPNFRGNRGRARYSNGETRPRGLRSRGYVSRHTRYARYTPHVRVRCVALTSDRHVFVIIMTVEALNAFWDENGKSSDVFKKVYFLKTRLPCPSTYGFLSHTVST